MSRFDRLTRSVAAALLAGAWTPEDLNRRAARFFGRQQRRARRRLIRDLIQNAPTPYPPNPSALIAHLRSSEHFLRLSSAKQARERAPFIVLDTPAFAPLSAFSKLGFPELSAPGDLAEWLEVTPQQLDWLADARCLHRRTVIPVLQHYFYTFAEKRHGPPRLIEAPKPRLRAIQRRILHEILDLLPAHENAHGFVRGRSCLTGARIHAGERLVVTFDLRNFFTSIPAARVHAIFRCLGYPWAVARLLTGLCTTATPASVFSRQPEGAAFDWQMRNLYGVPHLAQGAPTSPAIANLAAWSLDMRLTRLARRFGANYTRYADDLAFSGDGDFVRKLGPFQRLVEAIVRDEGFSLNASKTRMMDRSTCQRITGLVVNEHINVPRKAYDELKAILHNCVRYGPGEQNRQAVADFRAHLDGRVAWVEAANADRGAKLRRMFDCIRW
jgi:RNA-directed DNA polymerase